MRQALQDSEARFAALLEHVPDGALVSRSGGGFHELNTSACTLLGYTRDELLDLRVEDILKPEEHARLLPEWAALTAGKAHYPREWPLVRKDGTTIPIEVHAGRLPDGSTVVVLRDITEPKRVEKLLVDSTRELRALSTRLIAAQEDERRRVARELHDELGQSLTALKLRLEVRGARSEGTAEDTDAANVRMVDDAIAQVRRVALALRPSMLDDLGLVPALRWLADQATERAGLAIKFSVDLAGERLTPEVETACFRIAQEALTNVARHAAASRVALELRKHGGWVVMSVRDDGVGFDAKTARRRARSGRSFGLLGMEERARLADGRLEISSALGVGTTVRVRLPWRTPAASE